MKHIHADSMMRYAADAIESATPWEWWEYYSDGMWQNCHTHPVWEDGVYYRRAVVGVEYMVSYPVPINEPLSDGDVYYVPRLDVHDLVEECVAGSDDRMLLLMARGMVHRVRVHAEQHAKALLNGRV